MPPKVRVYLGALVPVLLVDRATKALALAHLPPGIPREVIGEAVRFTLVFNRNAAMDVTLGPGRAGASPSSRPSG